MSVFSCVGCIIVCGLCYQQYTPNTTQSHQWRNIHIQHTNIARKFHTTSFTFTPHSLITFILHSRSLHSFTHHAQHSLDIPYRSFQLNCCTQTQCNHSHTVKKNRPSRPISPNTLRSQCDFTGLLTVFYCDFTVFV